MQCRRLLSSWLFLGAHLRSSDRSSPSSVGARVNSKQVDESAYGSARLSAPARPDYRQITTRGAVSIALSPAARANRKCAPQPSVQGPCGSLFSDFQDMYLDFNRFISIGAVVSSPAVDRGVVYFGSMDGNLYALQ